MHGHALRHTVIDARRSRLDLGLRELLAYRDLFLILAYRDLRVRYAQTALGLAWALLQPVATLAIFTLVFGRAVKVETGGVPYPLFALSGMIAWTYFSFVITNVSGAIIGAQGMVTKVYFPRLVIPLSKAMVGLVDFAISFAFFGLLCFYYRAGLPASIVFLPLFVLATLAASLAGGLWLSALSVRFRDVQHVVPFLVQIGLYISPVAYPASLIPERFRALYFLNPMAGVVEGFRFCLVGGAPPDPRSYASFLMVAVLLLSGLFYFRHVERTVADVV
jgi:lipopolysaccharide transport system permease protein